MKAWEQFLTLTKLESLRNEVMIAIFIVNDDAKRSASVVKLQKFHQPHLFLSSRRIIHTQEWDDIYGKELNPRRREYFDAKMSSFYLIEV